MSHQFIEQRRQNVERMASDAGLRELSLRWMIDACRYKYSHNFDWLGRPIIQFPEDMVAVQEILWRVRPSVVIETGVARGGSVLLYASILELIGGDGLVLGVDIDIRRHNRRAIEGHALARRIRLVEGSSIDEPTVAAVRSIVGCRGPVLLVLDSNHTEAHVLRELQLYSPLVTKGSYVVVFDTLVERFPRESFPDRPWAPGDSPATAVAKFLKETNRFEVDEEIDAKLLISAAPGGYLRCVED